MAIYFILIHSKLFFGNSLFSIHRVYQIGPKISLLIRVPIFLQLSSRNISHNNIPGIGYSIRIDRSLGLHKAAESLFTRYRNFESPLLFGLSLRESVKQHYDLTVGTY